MIPNYTKSDAKPICRLYNHFIETSFSTLDLAPIAESDFAKRCAEINRSYPFLVYEDSGEVLGFAYASKWKEKAGYNKTLESTIYLADSLAGKGIGTNLYRALIKELKQMEVDNVVACLTLPNASSVALHEKLGFIKVGHFQRIAKKQHKEVDVGYWQLILD